MKDFDHRFASKYYFKVNPKDLTTHQWCKLINDDRKYCANWNLFKEIVYRIHRLRNKNTHLHSWHIENLRSVRDKNEKYIKQLEHKLKLCMKDIHLTKIYFNANTALDSVIIHLEKLKLENKRKSLYL
jgi:Fe-S-cluster containining protein